MVASQMIESDFSYQFSAKKPNVDPRIRSVVLDMRARHGAMRILGIGRGARSLCHDLHHSGYAVAFTESGDSGESNSTEVALDDYICTQLIDPSPVKDALFDMAISIEFEPFYTPSLLVRLAAMKLQYGGVFILSIPYNSYFKNLLTIFRGLWKFFFFSAWDHSHVKCWSRKCLTGLLKSHGFTIVEFVGVRGRSSQWESLILVARKTN